MARFEVLIKRSAVKEIAAISRKKDRQRVVERIRRLADDPRPPGCRKLSGRDRYTNLGKYLFEVREPDSGRLLYSRGFASIYGEWETTGEARKRHAAEH